MWMLCSKHQMDKFKQNKKELFTLLFFNRTAVWINLPLIIGSLYTRFVQIN